MKAWKSCAALAAIVILFIGSAMLFIPRLGIYTDEALIGNGIYARGAPWYSWTFGDSELPIMLISYVGALKTWIYAGIFSIWPPGPISLRLPMALLAAASLILFFRLLQRAVGATTGRLAAQRNAAWFGTLLLATDTSFLLIGATDFGFVVLQLFFKLAAILLLLRFHRESNRWALAGAFFLLGLALWDKAVFLWVLFGLGVAVITVFPRTVLRHATLKNLGIAAVSMLIGALPLVIYNIARPLETLRANAKLTREPVLVKAGLLAQTIDGHVMLGFMTAVDTPPIPGQPRRWYQSLSLTLADWTRHPQHNWMLVALLAASLALIPLWRTEARAPMLFGLIASVGTWIPMALTAGAGAAAQHTILLWPFPILTIAVALAYAPVRLAWAAVVLLCVSNLALTNQYYALFIHNGGAIRWTDAIFELDKYLATVKTDNIFVMDWGVIETINLLSEGETPVVAPKMSDPAWVRRSLTNPRYVFVAHTPGFAIQPENRAVLEAAARAGGYREVPLQTIGDRNGRPTFEVFSFRKD
ncbi:MAG TPA: hypothetical protein VGP79_00380 [Bryobacteraceae bacterium]|jgi:hypothetical protein|nr:hypothetical protein [Bryobacteraceae bacterium]